MLGRTTKERLLRDLTTDYEPAIDPGDIDLKMKVALICSWQDNSTGFVLSSGWEVYVSIGRVSYIRISLCLLFLFPVKDGKLSTEVNATFDASCYG